MAWIPWCSYVALEGAALWQWGRVRHRTPSLPGLVHNASRATVAKQPRVEVPLRECCFVVFLQRQHASSIAWYLGCQLGSNVDRWQSIPMSVENSVGTTSVCAAFCMFRPAHPCYPRRASFRNEPICGVARVGEQGHEAIQTGRKRAEPCPGIRNKVSFKKAVKGLGSSRSAFGTQGGRRKTPCASSNDACSAPERPKQRGDLPPTALRLYRILSKSTHSPPLRASPSGFTSCGMFLET